MDKWERTKWNRNVSECNEQEKKNEYMILERKEKKNEMFRLVRSTIWHLNI